MEMNDHFSGFESDKQEKIFIEILEKEIESKINNEEFEYNPNKTKRRMFLQTLVSETKGKHMGAELAYVYGIMSRESLDKFYKIDDIDQLTLNEEYELKTKELEEFFANELTKKTSLSGKFFFGWESAKPDESDELRYGICYSEDLVSHNNFIQKILYRLKTKN